MSVTKVLSEDENNNFGEKFYRGIINQKLGKNTKFQVWVVKRFLSKEQKTVGGMDSTPPPRPL